MGIYRRDICNCWRCAGLDHRYDMPLYHRSSDTEFYRKAQEEEQENQEEQ